MSRPLLFAASLLTLLGCEKRPSAAPSEPPGLPLRQIETSLCPLAAPLASPQPGDWLATHEETGQTFAEYLNLKPKRRGSDLTTIYLLLLGDFSPEQREVLAITQRYLGVIYQATVKVQ